jgi:hypothetical protein
MEIKFIIIIEQYTTLFLTRLYMLHTSEVGGMSSERTSTSFHSLVFLQTLLLM